MHTENALSPEFAYFGADVFSTVYDGEKKINAGDSMTIVVQTYDEQRTVAELEDILGSQPQLHGEKANDKSAQKQ